MKKWNNWSGNVKSSPEQIASPTTENEVTEIVTSAKKIRSVGTGHSFTPLCATDAMLVSLNEMSGFIGDFEKNVEFWAGTTIENVGKLSYEHGYAMPTQGDIDCQTLAGAFNTATHGSSGTHPCMAAFSSSMTLVDGQGNKRTIQEGSDEYYGAIVGLGLFGIVTRYALKLETAVPYYRHEFQLPIKQIINEFDDLRTDFNTCEFLYFPFTSMAFVTTTKPMTSEITGAKDASSEMAQKLGRQSSMVVNYAALISKYIPFMTPYLMRGMVKGINPTKLTGPAHIVNANYRYAKFNEMEFAIPIEYGTKCLREIINVIESKNIRTIFPLQVRFVKGDDFWMSPFYQQDSLAIAVHQHSRQNYASLFKACEEIFMKYHGRPHWGKIHSMDQTQVKKTYSKFAQFTQLRKEFDPENKFLNPYLQELFG